MYDNYKVIVEDKENSEKYSKLRLSIKSKDKDSWIGLAMSGFAFISPLGYKAMFEGKGKRVDGRVCDEAGFLSKLNEDVSDETEKVTSEELKSFCKILLSKK